MKKYRLSLIVLSAVMLLSLVMVGPARTAGLTEISPAAFYPWRTAFFGDSTVLKNPSTAFSGHYDIPIISTTSFETTIQVGMPAADGVGNCGPVVNLVRTWDCTNYDFPITTDLVDLSVISPVAVHTTQDDFKTGWTIVDKVPLSVILFEEIWTPTGGRLSTAKTPLLALTTESPFYGFNVIGSTSLDFDSSGLPHAAVILNKTATGEEHLVYIHPGTDNGSCGFGLNFQCEIIAIREDLGAAPVLHLTADDKPMITYYDQSSDKIMVAYDEDSTGLTANCGPGGDTWYCLEIIAGTLDPSGNGITYGDKPSIAIGNSAKFIVYTVSQVSTFNEINKSLHLAEYVGSGGNCGEERWECGFVQSIDTSVELINTAFSIQVDPLDYPVIAFSYQPPSSPEQCMDVTYPAERAGGNPGTWRRDFITCTDPIFDEFALSDSGLGFIGYVDKTEKNVMLAIQDYLLYLPAIVR